MSGGYTQDEVRVCHPRRRDGPVRPARAGATAVIDLHFHILPQLDDGPPDLQRSVELARAAESDGIQLVAATPHLREDHPQVRAPELAARCRELNAALADADVALEVVEGGELDVLWVQEADEEDLWLASYGQRGTDVLLETPYGAIAPSFDAAVKRLQTLGFRILLAHPERNRAFQQAPDRLSDLVRDGVLIQVTAGSLVPTRRRSRSHELAVQLVEHGLAHVIGSDAHSAGEFRPPNLSSGLDAARAIDPRVASWMVLDAPLAILAGEPLPARPGATVPRRRA
jgi:protein-tyrosine phosphatase